MFGQQPPLRQPAPPGHAVSQRGTCQPEWTGVPLARLLHAAGLGQGATTIVVRGRDGTRDHSFAKGLPLHKALHPDTLLATHLNGQPLTHLRGGPARLAVPGWFGIWSVKWVDAIEVHSGPYDGYWQTARYVYRWPDDRPTTPLMELPVKSLIAQPREGQRFQPGPIEISGYAWSGQGRIASVDVRIGDGEWTSAQLSQPKSQWAWCRWDYAWNNAPPGRHAIASRARDDTGREQPAQMDWNELGYANNAVQPVVVDISPG